MTLKTKVRAFAAAAEIPDEETSLLSSTQIGSPEWISSR